jgi:kynureninase
LTELLNRKDCEDADRADPLRDRRGLFDIPDGLIYLDGNSLGVLPRSVMPRMQRVIAEEWGKGLITSWNDHGWFALPRAIGDRIAPLIGAPPGTVVACDTISVNVFKLVGAALALRPDRRTILSDTGNFPTDLYMVRGLLDFLGRDYQLKMVAPEAVADAIDDGTALVMLTEVDYRTARRHDMTSVTRKAHACGALILWDLAHSAGALPVDLAGSAADLAVGCTYKYLNGGPGSPAFLYVRQDLQDRLATPLSGWWGHASPFDFDLDYRPATGIARQQCGTQSILAMAALDAALDAWNGIDMQEIRRKSLALAGLFIARVEALCGSFGVRLSGPRDLGQRGSHVSFHCPEGYAVMQTLIAERVIGDFRAPDQIRFGVTPLYTRYVDVWDAAEKLHDILASRRWNHPDFLARKPVT